jgi:Tfp pilus assembly protein PilE
MMHKLSPLHSTARPRQGFTIVEVVMTFIIIGVLTVILVPMVSNRSKEAKISAATSDMQRLADAEERACVDTGYLYRPYVLNDNRGADGGNANALNDLTVTPTNRVGQNILDNTITANNFYETPAKIFIYSTGNGSGNYNNSYTGLFSTMARSETSFNWNGPYVNWYRDVNLNDWPDDPWGHDYLFFTRQGVIFPGRRTNGSSGTRTGTDYSEVFQVSVSDADILGTSFTYDKLDLQFDRPTWLSLGPDGMPGDGTNPSTTAGKFGQGDDIVRQFGGSGVGTN